LPFCYAILLILCPSFFLPVLPLLYFSLTCICLQSDDRKLTGKDRFPRH
jgi:hypothetical protein